MMGPFNRFEEAMAAAAQFGDGATVVPIRPGTQEGQYEPTDEEKATLQKQRIEGIIASVRQQFQAEAEDRSNLFADFFTKGAFEWLGRVEAQNAHYGESDFNKEGFINTVEQMLRRRDILASTVKVYLGAYSRDDLMARVRTYMNDEDYDEAQRQGLL